MVVPVNPVHTGSINSDPDFTSTIITGDESKVYRYDPETKSFRHFPYNEYPTGALNITSLKCSLISTEAIYGGGEIIHTFEGLRSAHASAFH